MTDNERVIKGLESLHDRLMDAAEKNAIATLDAHMVADALALLKEQDECENCAIAIEDRQPVIRCSDCRHYGYKDMTNVDGFCYCLKRHEYPNPDWYCADGERK